MAKNSEINWGSLNCSALTTLRGLAAAMRSVGNTTPRSNNAGPRQVVFFPRAPAKGSS